LEHIPINPPKKPPTRLGTPPSPLKSHEQHKPGTHTYRRIVILENEKWIPMRIPAPKIPTLVFVTTIHVCCPLLRQPWTLARSQHPTIAATEIVRKHTYARDEATESVTVRITALICITMPGRTR
jgi:hypothetical protein